MITKPVLKFRRLWALLGLAILLAPAAGYSAVFTVNSATDAVDANIDGVCQTAAGQCTLRAAVQEANASIGVADTINLPAGTYTLTIPPVAGGGGGGGGGGVDITGVNGDLDILGGSGQLTISGAGAATTIIDGGAVDGVFETNVQGGLGASAIISGVTIRNGSTANGNGGCVQVGNGTTLALNNSAVTNCTAGSANPGGGAVDNSGTLTMNTVAVTNNSSTAGAVNNGAAGVLTWTIGTVSGNIGGGLNNSGGTMSLTNVTVSGNTTAENGAGIDNRGALTLQNVTIAGNISTTAINIGGIRNDVARGGTASLRNTIISGNLPANCGGAMTSLGNNLDNGNTCGLVGAGDVSNTDPLLAVLGDNGGAVQTRALLTGSPAIDTGSATVFPPTDARGIARPVDGDGNGTLISDKGAFEFRPPTIVVTPSAINFGTVTNGTASDQAITLTNAGDGDLIIGQIAGAAVDPVAAPFSIPVDNCTGRTAPRGTSCTLTARFTSLAAGTSTDTFNIPSNDPLTPSVSFSLIGTGTAALVANISATDSMAPTNDLQVPFGGVSVGSTADATVTVTNTGTASLVIGTVALASPLSAPFSVVVDNCSNKTLVPDGICTLTIRFAPASVTVVTGSFDIPSNDPDTPSIMISLSGSGISTTGNNPPSAPSLISPANGQTGVGTTVEFSWQKSVDPDGDAITYHFYNCANQDFTGCPAVDIAPAAAPKLAYVGMGVMGAGIVVFGFVMGGGLQRKRRTALWAVALLMSGVLIASCGGGSSSSAPQPIIQPDTGPSVNQVTHTVSGLAPGTTFFWKVVADDGKGGLTTSETRSFTTQ